MSRYEEEQREDVRWIPFIPSLLNQRMVGLKQQLV
jgi:hypothetical protein